MSSILVTGSTRGLGLELVQQLLTMPSSIIGVIFATGRSPNPPSTLQSIIDSSNGRMLYVNLDVSNDTSVKEGVRQVEAYLGGHGLDMIVNNAAIQTHEGRATDATPESMEKLFSANVSSVLRVMSAFLPLLEKGKQKKILNITSTLGSIGLIKNFALADTPSYKISKAAVNMLTSLWALELGPKGFTVFVASPGWLRTELGTQNADLDVSQGASQVIKILIEATPEKDNGAFRDIYVEGHPTYPGTNPPW